MYLCVVEGGQPIHALADGPVQGDVREGWRCWRTSESCQESAGGFCRPLSPWSGEWLLSTTPTVVDAYCVSSIDVITNIENCFENNIELSMSMYEYSFAQNIRLIWCRCKSEIRKNLTTGTILAVLTKLSLKVFWPLCLCLSSLV